MASTEYRVLRKAWEASLRAALDTGADYWDAREQSDYDALIDYVESHGLNYTTLDPRDSDS